MSENTETRGHTVPVTEEYISALESLPGNVFHGNGTLCESAGIDASALEAVYYIAYGNYEQEHYEEALRTFGLLCLFNHTDLRFWKGMGACSLMMKDYDGAICAFEYATTYIKDVPELRLRIAECYLHIRNHEAAKSALETVISVTAENNRLNKRAHGLLKNLESL